MDFRFARVVLTYGLFFSACATSAGEAAAPTPFPSSEMVRPPAEASTRAAAPTKAIAIERGATCDMFVSPGVLRRSLLVRVIDAGLPRWMQGVQGDRALANHRFQGWLIKSMYPEDPCYQAIELREGDIVQKVNGKSIERPEQAFDVVQSLRSAPALVVDFLRNGKAQKMTLSIVEQ